MRKKAVDTENPPQAVRLQTK